MHELLAGIRRRYEAQPGGFGLRAAAADAFGVHQESEGTVQSLMIDELEDVDSHWDEPSLLRAIRASKQLGATRSSKSKNRAMLAGDGVDTFTFFPTSPARHDAPQILAYPRLGALAALAR